MLVSLDELNLLSAEEFSEALRPLFEAARPLADALYARRPFVSYTALIDSAEALALDLDEPPQVEIVNAHPRIGENPRRLSASSFREQGYDRPAGDDPILLGDLAELNQQYEGHFGFRFVVFVNKRPKSEIVGVLRERLKNSREEELRTGLRALFLIARDRLAALPEV